MPQKSRLAGLFFLSVILNFTNVYAKGRGSEIGEGIGEGIGESIGGATGSLDLSPIYTAVFALVIVTIVCTLSQFIRAAKRVKTPVLPPDTPTLPYQVGKLFPSFLLLYTFALIANYTLYAVFVAFSYAPSGGILPEGFVSGMSFIGQVADVTFIATFLSLIAYRERLQLNPAQSAFNLKSFLDGWVLSTVLILGVAADALKGLDSRNMGIAYQSFLFVASMDVIVSAIMVYIRFDRSDIQDKIIRNIAFIVSPLIFVGALFRIIVLGLLYNTRDVFFDFSALDLANVIIFGVVSIVVVEVALGMGALPKPAKATEEESDRGGSSKA